MKKNLRSLAILLGFLITILSCESKPVFYPELAVPNFKILSTSDRAVFTNTDLPEKGILLIKYFSPDCNHCQEEAKLLVSKKDSLQNIQTLWVSGSWSSLDSMQAFRERYGIDELNPIAIGKETDDKLVRSYKLKSVPFSIVYKDNQLLKEYNDDINLQDLFAMNKGTFVGEPRDSILVRFRKLK